MLVHAKTAKETHAKAQRNSAIRVKSIVIKQLTREDIELMLA